MSSFIWTGPTVCTFLAYTPLTKKKAVRLLFSKKTMELCDLI